MKLIVPIGFGLFFIGMAIFILIAAWDTEPFGAAIASLIIGFCGIDLIISAIKDKPSILSRIGPLP